MGQLQVKSPWYNTNQSYTADVKHAVCELPDGRTALLVPDHHEGVTTPSRIHIYILNAGQTALSPTTPYYFDYANISAATPKWDAKASMAVDSVGNLHIAYRWLEGTVPAQSLRYRKLTYSAGTGIYTVGAEQIVSAAATNRALISLDIDITNDTQNYPTIVASYRTGTTVANYTSTVVVYNRNSASWPAQTLRSAIQGAAYGDVCIATRQDAAVGGNFNMLISWNPGPPISGQTDTGDIVWALRAAVGGAFVAGSQQTIYGFVHKNYNGGFRAWDIFWLSNDTFLLHCVVRSSPALTWHVLVTTAADSNVWSQATTPRAVAPPNASFGRYSNRKFASASLVRDPATPTIKGSLISWQLSAGAVWQVPYEWAREGTTWKITESKSYAAWSKGYTVASNFLVPWGGERGKFGSTERVGVMTPHAQMNTKTVVRKVYWWKRPSRANCVISIPAQNATVATNTPDVSIDITGVGVDSAAIRQKLELQVSTSSTFASSVFTITQPDASLAYYSTTKATLKIPLLNYPLVQGIWYARARMIDQFGAASAWSDVRTFTVSHPPGATNLSPRDDSVIVYNAAGTVFGWKFTDAYAKDVQTAYQVDVVDTLTQSLVVSTGKIAGSVQTAGVVIPSSQLEKNIDWFVTVWDGDDVQSQPVSGGTVLLTQPPSPVIDYPTLDGDDIPTAMPAFTWLPGISGTKTQTAYRIQIRGSDDTLLHDTRVVASADTTYVMPAGILRNGKRYKMTLTVTDSTALDTTVSRIFDAVWPVPVTMPRPTVFLDMYDEQGFASVVVSTVGRDEDFIQFHLYRRALENNAPWELVHITATAADYIVYKDYFLPAGVTSEYVLTQLADRFGDQIESTLDTAPKFQIKPVNARYWLIDKTNLEKSIRLQGVTGDSYTPEQEETSYNVVGRGRQFEVGENIGIMGTIQAKLRDQNSGGFYQENYNFLGNPNFEDDTLGNPEGWTSAITSGSGNFIVDSIAQPGGPTNRRSGRLRIIADKTSTTSGAFIGSMVRSIAKSSYFPMTAGQTYFGSVWISIPAPHTGYTVRLQGEWCEGSTIRSTETFTLSTDTTTVTTSQVLETRYVNGTLWYRIGRVFTVPAGYPALDNLRIRFGIYSIASGTTVVSSVTVDLEGGTLTFGSQPVAYFSGAEKSGEWIGVEKVDPSFTPGMYTARKQRQELIKVQQDQHELYLRNPFGDVWLVHVSNMTIERDAGMASSEGVGIEIPYFELRA